MCEYEGCFFNRGDNGTPPCGKESIYDDFERKDCDILNGFKAGMAHKQEQDSELVEYAQELAVAFWNRCYKEVSPEFELFDNLREVLFQIDNMIAGMPDREHQIKQDEQNKFILMLESGIDRKTIINLIKKGGE